MKWEIYKDLEKEILKIAEEEKVEPNMVLNRLLSEKLVLDD